MKQIKENKYKVCKSSFKDIGNLEGANLEKSKVQTMFFGLKICIQMSKNRSEDIDDIQYIKKDYFGLV